VEAILVETLIKSGVQAFVGLIMLLVIWLVIVRPDRKMIDEERQELKAVVKQLTRVATNLSILVREIMSERGKECPTDDESEVRSTRKVG
jgi:type II secretory pathway component PulM